jgi:hypothetical protein
MVVDQFSPVSSSNSLFIVVCRDSHGSFVQAGKKCCPSLFQGLLFSLFSFTKIIS